MIQNTKVARDDFVLQIGSRGDINTIAMVSNNDDSSFESNITAEGDISRDGQVVKFQNIWDGLKTLQEVFHLEWTQV